MKLKIFLIIFALMSLSLGVRARVIGQFPGWERLEEMSSNIVVVSCRDATPPNPNIDVINAPRSDFQVVVDSALKGSNNPRSTRLLTDHDLQKGRTYLVFGYLEGDGYEAYEKFRVVPLALDLQLDSIKGKTIDEQLRVLFQSGVEEMKNKIDDDEREKDLLEQALLR